MSLVQVIGLEMTTNWTFNPTQFNCVKEDPFVSYTFFANLLKFATTRGYYEHFKKL